MTDPVNGYGPLRAVLEEARQEQRCGQGDLTVLATQNDPYRLDTPANHRDAAWFREQFERSGRRRIHLRGLHYSVVAHGDVLRPNGEPYINDDANWMWLQAFAAKAARWLGYVPFTSITDERNSPPVIYRRDPETPMPWASILPRINISESVNIEPHVLCDGFEGRQPYHLVIFGEKSSLAEVVLPIAERFDADVYLPTGEISDTLLYRMASDASYDGRPMQVFTLSDCDPAGYQMPISIARKLQALRDLEFHDLEFEVRPVALTVDHVRELRLPSTPLKVTELRADRWRDAFGVEQTEIDALATLQPLVLRRIINEAILPFYDLTLGRRVREAHRDWQDRARRSVMQQLDADRLDTLKAEAEARLSEMREEIDRYNHELEIAGSGPFELPPVEIPSAEVDESLHGLPLISSAWPWTEQTRALKARKAYEAEP